MVYKKGTVVNSYELTHIIHAVLRDTGWRLVSGNSAEGIDSAFYSSGEDGNQDIYIRVAANQHDIVATGDMQFPYSDAYNGYVNLFAYQYYPDDSPPSEGCTELGRNGPLMYFMDGDDGDDIKLESYNLFTCIGNHNDGYTAGGRRHVLDSGTSLYENEGGGYINQCTDGHRFIWFGGYSQYLIRMDMAQSPKPTDWVPRGDFFSSCANRPTVWSRRGPRDPMVWALMSYNAGASYGGFATYNQLTGAAYEQSNTSGYATPPWWNEGYAHRGWAVQGVRRNRERYLYIARGYDTGHWARYDMENNEWSGYLPNMLVQTGYGSDAVYVMKENTGYEYDRIYYISGFNRLYFGSATVYDDGTTSSWTYHKQLPEAAYHGDALLYAGGDRLFFVVAGSRKMYHWFFPEGPYDEGGDWIATDPSPSNVWFAETISQSPNQYPTFCTQNHLCSRVGVDEQETTEYWIFCNKDRIIVITKSYEAAYSSDYEMAYAGLFETDYDNTVTTTTEEHPEGTTTLKVANTSMFKVEESYQLIKIGDGFLKEGFNGELRKMGIATSITVTAVRQSASEIDIETPLVDTFPAGSKIGQDPQPVCVFMYGKDAVQTLTNKHKTDSRISEDPPWQTYKTTYLSQTAQTRSERIDGTTIFPVRLQTYGIDYWVDSEVRGRLIGVYGGGVVGNEGEVTIEGEKYVSFSIYNSAILGRVFIGPTEE